MSTTTTRRPSRYDGPPPRRYRRPIGPIVVWSLAAVLFVFFIVAISPHAWNALYAWKVALTSPPAQTFATAPAQPSIGSGGGAAPIPASAPTAPPVAPETATDIAAAQQSQPGDYQEMTKPNTRVLPTLAPEGVHVQEQTAPVSPSVANEGTKPARHHP